MLGGAACLPAPLPNGRGPSSRWWAAHECALPTPSIVCGPGPSAAKWLRLVALLGPPPSLFAHGQPRPLARSVARWGKGPSARVAVPARPARPRLRRCQSGAQRPSWHRASLVPPPASPGLCPRPSSVGPAPWAWGPGPSFGRAVGFFPPAPLSWCVACPAPAVGGCHCGPASRLRARGLRALPPGRGQGPRYSPWGAGRLVGCGVRLRARGCGGLGWLLLARKSGQSEALTGSKCDSWYGHWPVLVRLPWSFWVLPWPPPRPCRPRWGLAGSAWPPALGAPAPGLRPPPCIRLLPAAAPVGLPDFDTAFPAAILRRPRFGFQVPARG